MPLDFHTLCEEALSAAGEITPAQRDRVIEDLRLRFKYANQYVAYVDRIETAGRTRKSARQLLAVSPDLRKIQEALAEYPENERGNVVVDFVDPLGGDLSVPLDSSQR
jgi:hypothetical protein